MADTAKRDSAEPCPARPAEHPTPAWQGRAPIWLFRCRHGHQLEIEDLDRAEKMAHDDQPCTIDRSHFRLVAVRLTLIGRTITFAR